jgi:hypothetical protein
LVSDPSNKTYRELLLSCRTGIGGNPDRAPSTHWDHEGVVAHLRFMEKTDAEGKRVLFIEEVQSDWHQKGRDQGYAHTGIPDAPFKSSWPALVMKRAIRWAVDNGFDKVAWTTGEEQAERYNLSERSARSTFASGRLTTARTARPMRSTSPYCTLVAQGHGEVDGAGFIS